MIPSVMPRLIPKSSALTINRISVIAPHPADDQWNLPARTFQRLLRKRGDHLHLWTEQILQTCANAHRFLQRVTVTRHCPHQDFFAEFVNELAEAQRAGLL